MRIARRGAGIADDHGPPPGAREPDGAVQDADVGLQTDQHRGAASGRGDAAGEIRLPHEAEHPLVEFATIRRQHAQHSGVGRTVERGVLDGDDRRDGEARRDLDDEADAVGELGAPGVGQAREKAVLDVDDAQQRVAAVEEVETDIRVGWHQGLLVAGSGAILASPASAARRSERPRLRAPVGRIAAIVSSGSTPNAAGLTVMAIFRATTCAPQGLARGAL